MTTYRDGRAWRAGPHVVYQRFAATALDALPRPFAGLRAVDVGAGTGAIGEELVARGASVISTDLAHTMLLQAPAPRVVSDARALGLRDRCVDLATAGFLLSHVEDPASALAEIVRLVRPGGLVLATGYPTGAVHPVKQAVDTVLASFGYRPPEWYLRLKATGEARVGDPVALLSVAGEGRLVDPRVQELTAPLTGLRTEAVVAWRLGMAQVAGFMADLPAGDRDRLTAQANAAVSRVGTDQPVRLLLLAGNVS